MKKTRVFSVLIFLSVLTTVLCIIVQPQSYGVGKLTSCDPKFFSYCNVVTAPRLVDGVERLFTNHTFTNIVPIGNNFTVAGVFISQKGVRYKVEHKFCDYVKQLWLHTYLKTVAHVNLPCPVPASTHQVINMEIPPPFIPVPMLPGTYRLEGEMYTTVSKVRVTGVQYTIHFADKGNKKNGKNKKG